MPAALDGRPVPAYTPLLARAGQVLAIGAARSGLRGYLAVFGGVDTPPVLGSRSTDLKLPDGRAGWPRTESWGCAAHWGGTRHGGTALAADLRQRGKPPAGHGAHPPARPWRFFRVGGSCRCSSVRCPAPRPMPLPQWAAAFVHGVYALTADCDRMACKLQGPQIETVDGSDIVSDGIVAGSVQVSANGQPIVMLADHQTTGGYAKIATVISADLSAMAQLRPGEKLAFQYVSAAQAVAGARAQAAVLDKSQGTDEIMDFATMKPADLRGLIRKGELTGPDHRHVQRLCPGQPCGAAQGAGVGLFGCSASAIPKPARCWKWRTQASEPLAPNFGPKGQRYCYRYPALRVYEHGELTGESTPM